MSDFTRRLVFRIIMSLCAAAICGGAQATLPEEGLQRAKMAEQFLKDSQTSEAIKILEKLSSDYPEEPAVYLRLAQIYDADNVEGEALFYYRKYASVAGQNIRDEALIRLQSLELMKSARDGAEAFAAARKARTATVVATPTPAITVNTEMVNRDGSVVPITEANVGTLLKGEDGSVPSFPTAATAQATFSGGLPLVDTTAPAANAPKRPTTQAPVEPATDARLPVSAPAIQDPAAAAAPASRTPRSTNQGLQVSVSTGSRPSPQQAATRMTPQADLSRAVSTPAPRPAASSRREDDLPADPGLGERVFRAQRGAGSGCALNFANEHEYSIVTISAKPLAGGSALNVILSPGERRKMSIEPGSYAVVIVITTTMYPPGPPTDKRFDFDFRPGTDYLSVFNDQTFL